MIRRPPRSTQSRSSAASDVYKRQGAKRFSGSDRVGIGVAHPRICPACNRIQRVEPECHQCWRDTDAEEWNHEREQSDAWNRLQYSECADRRLRNSSSPFESKSEWNGNDHSGEQSECDELEMPHRECGYRCPAIPQILHESRLPRRWCSLRIVRGASEPKRD